VELSNSHMPPTPGPKMDFVTIKNTDPVKYIVLSDFISAHDVHWLGRRTQPCKAPKARCEWCEAQKPIRWKGYIHCLRYPEIGKSIFLCLTPGCGYEMLLADPPPTILRGRVLAVWRANKSSTSAMLWRWVTEQHVSADALPPALDPGKYLETVFRLRKPLED
jgi:hypothetical protein